MLRAALARVRPALFRSGENAREKAFTISGADRFIRRGGTCRLHAIFMNRLLIMWGYQEELSSTAACSRAEGNCPLNSPASHVPRKSCVTASLAAFAYLAATRSGKARIAIADALLRARSDANCPQFATVVDYDYR
jgi:hypothetical protein